MKAVRIAIITSGLVAALQAQATLFDLQYSDPNGNTLGGVLTANLVPGSGVEYQAIGGSLALTSVDYPTLDGSYSLVSGGTGAFQIDNILFYPGNPIVDWYGALLLQSSSGTFLNLFSADANGNPIPYGVTPAASTYALYAYNNGYTTLNPFNVNPYSNVGGPATASLNPLFSQQVSPAPAVPEPATLLSGALMLLPFGASALRILRKQRAA